MEISKGRLEAFSDGVIAIIITIMVLNIPLPGKNDFSGVLNFVGAVFIYFLSFVVVGYFWNKHHMIFSHLKSISPKIIWYNLLFLFFLSLIPVFTKWVIYSPNAIVTAIGYDVVYLCVNVISVFIFHSSIGSSKQEFLDHMKESREKYKNDVDFKQRQKAFTKMFFISTAVVIVIITASIVFRFSSYVLLGLPVLISLVNLVFENPNHHRA